MTACDPKQPSVIRSITVKSRLLSGAAGLAVIVFSVIWPRVLGISEVELIGSVGGYLAPVGIILGVYLLFYSMTGEWLPKLRNRKTRP